MMNVRSPKDDRAERTRGAGLDLLPAHARRRRPAVRGPAGVPQRAFRHSAIYANTASGIDTPADRAGKTLGEFATYGHDAGFWPKGILADEYGFRPEQARWVVGGLDFPCRRSTSSRSCTPPTSSALYDENRALFGDDWWPYGVERNRAAVDTLLRYHHEQGLSARLRTCEDVFVPELLDT